MTQWSSGHLKCSGGLGASWSDDGEDDDVDDADNDDDDGDDG